MVRPLRIEYPGAVYHVTARGDRREPIANDDADWDELLRQQIYLGDDAFITRMQKLAGIDGTAAPGSAHKAQVSKTHLSAPTHAGDLQAYASRRAANKAQRNRNIADAFYQGGHSQTPIASAFGALTSTVSRVVIGFERGEA